MPDIRVAVVPVGKVSAEEVEAALSRAAKVLRHPIELKANLGVPHGVEDRERGQFRASLLISRLRASFPQLGPGRMIGAEGSEQAPSLSPDAIVFVSDVDLYTAKSDGAFAALLPSKGLGVVSLRRLREAFYRRSADPAKQRARLTKELLRAICWLRGMPPCSDPHCVLSASTMLADIDIKDEKLCRACAQRMFKGTVRI